MLIQGFQGRWFDLHLAVLVPFVGHACVQHSFVVHLCSVLHLHYFVPLSREQLQVGNLAVVEESALQ